MPHVVRKLANSNGSMLFQCASCVIDLRQRFRDEQLLPAPRIDFNRAAVRVTNALTCDRAPVKGGIWEGRVRWRTDLGSVGAEKIVAASWSRSASVVAVHRTVSFVPAFPEASRDFHCARLLPTYIFCRCHRIIQENS